MVFIYYDNPLMLAYQIKCWNSYVGVLDPLPTIVLVDDCSQKFPAEDVLKINNCDCPMKLFRIEEDIKFNVSGARNLGCSASDNWIYVSDIDTVILAADAKKLMNVYDKTIDSVYMPRRVQHETEKEMRPAIVNLMFHKSAFLQIGGYDEDYAGSYGREETDFWNRMKKVKKLITCHDVTIRVFSPGTIQDANTRDLNRKDIKNHDLYEKKLAAGFANPINPLRFPWRQII
jgi:hypothetical protein